MYVLKFYMYGTDVGFTSKSFVRAYGIEKIRIGLFKSGSVFFFCAYGSTFCISSFKLRDFLRTLHQSMHVYDIEGFRMDLFKSGFKFGFFPPTWFCISFLFKGVGFFHVKYRGCMGLFKSGSKFGFFFHV